MENARSGSARDFGTAEPWARYQSQTAVLSKGWLKIQNFPILGSQREMRIRNQPSILNHLMIIKHLGRIKVRDP